MVFKKVVSKFKKEKETESQGIKKMYLKDEKEDIKEEIQQETEKSKEVEINQASEDIPLDGKQQEIKTNKEKGGFFAKLKQGLTKTRQGITNKVEEVLKTYQKVDEELFEEIEEILITSDTGVNTTMKIIDELRIIAKERKITEAEDLKDVLKEILINILESSLSYNLNTDLPPVVMLIVGVNGVGKTTSIGKIAHKLRQEGKKVMLAAGDTFRAAAIDQLEIWGNRVGVDVIKHKEGADPAAVIYDAIQSAKARKIDVLICDTAGRLHNKKNLMNELGKVKKVIEREFPEASREVLLVLDATTGQNAVQQAKTFKEVTDITGIILTKLDGTAKGGIVLGISDELNIPVKLIGVGEGMNDLQEFVPQDFVNALFEEDE